MIKVYSHKIKKNASPYFASMYINEYRLFYHKNNKIDDFKTFWIFQKLWDTYNFEYNAKSFMEQHPL